jgi:predicted aldo/keto reductase-like oxidoreductase
MEPGKGVTLARLPEEAMALCNEFYKDRSPLPSAASLAIRYVATLLEVQIVLSGMSSLEQMDDNLRQMTPFKPLNEAERKAISQAQKALDAAKMIPCTACHYCTEGCPMQIPIPEIFTVYNRKEGSPHFRTVREYTIVTTDRGKASDCVQCGQCEGACPQHLEIISLLGKCRELMEE